MMMYIYNIYVSNPLLRLGQYLGAAHSRCNTLRAEVKGKLCGFAHNFSGFDSHIVMSALAERRKRDGDLKCKGKRIRLQAIPLNTQKFKILKLNNVTLLDSLSFLNDSLDRLVDNLKASNHEFKIMRQWLADKEKQDLMMRKGNNMLGYTCISCVNPILSPIGVYPYEYMTSILKLDDTSLPPPEAFASQLSGTSGATDADYAHACKVWDVFNCRNLRDFSELYVKADCYQLMEAILELRVTLYEEFNLDMCHFFSLPMMAKACMLKHTGAEVELLHDEEMIHLVKDNIR